MKNIARITPQLVIKAKERLDYLKVLKVLGKHGYFAWTGERISMWSPDRSSQFINSLSSGQLQEFYKDIMNEISSQTNSSDGSSYDEE